MPEQLSRLLLLPGELRNYIYDYAVQEPGGYLYDPATNRLLTAGGEPVDLGLEYSCPQIWHETHGNALSQNTITFRTWASLPPSPDVPSRAIRFRRLMDRHLVSLHTMLAWAAPIVTKEHVDALALQFPGNKSVERLQNLDAEDRKRVLSLRGFPSPARQYCHASRLILQSLVSIVSEDPWFAPLTAKEFDRNLREGMPPPYHVFNVGGDAEYDDSKHQPVYVPGSVKRLLQWDIKPWYIPSERDLLIMEMDFPKEHSDPPREPYPIWVSVFLEKAYYSAAACAARFLQSLDPMMRMCIRTIVLDEEHHSVCQQECHVQALVPYLRENPKLHVEMRLDIWNILLYPSYATPQFRISGRALLINAAKWIWEADILAQRLPGIDKRCTMVFTNKDNVNNFAVQQVWAGLQRVAMMQEAVAYMPDAQPAWTPSVTWQGAVTNNYPELIRAVTAGKLPIRFDTNMGTIWDAEEEAVKLHRFFPPVLEAEWLMVLVALDEQWEQWSMVYCRYRINVNRLG